MAERSIIQNAWQVRALLDGRRTQIRVPVMLNARARQLRANGAAQEHSKGEEASNAE